MVRINLLPIREILRARELKHFAFVALGILVGSIVLMVLTYVFFSNKVSSLEAEQRTQQTKLDALKEKTKEIEERKQRIARLQKQVDTIKDLTEKRDTPAPLMSAISLAMPQEVWIKQMTKNGKFFTIDGVGLDNTVVVRFVTQLKNLPADFTQNPKFLTDEDTSKPRFFSRVELKSLISAQQAGPNVGAGAMSFHISGYIQ